MIFKWILFAILCSLFYYVPSFIYWRIFGTKIDNLKEEIENNKKKNSKHCRYCKYNEIDDCK